MKSVEQNSLSIEDLKTYLYEVFYNRIPTKKDLITIFCTKDKYEEIKELYPQALVITIKEYNEPQNIMEWHK